MRNADYELLKWMTRPDSSAAFYLIRHADFHSLSLDSQATTPENPWE